jgi:hypothetical protein
MKTAYFAANDELLRNGFFYKQAKKVRFFSKYMDGDIVSFVNSLPPNLKQYSPVEAQTIIPKGMAGNY